jgi:hypothetical protein
MFIDAFALSFFINWLRLGWRARHPNSTNWGCFERDPMNYRRDPDICAQHVAS